MAVAVPHVLYRLFDANDVLLYIGITGNLKTRLAYHAKDKPWWPEVERVAVEWHPTRDVAKRAETKAIAAEQPRYNRAEVKPDLRVALPNLSITLPEWGSADRPSLFQQLSAVLGDSSMSHADARLRCLNILLTGDSNLPRGAALAKLARQCGVSKSEDYNAARLDSAS